jgi:predicted RNase H-like HicB family nuclease
MDHQVITIHLQIDLFKRDGHWEARLPEGPNVVVDGDTREEALLKAKAIALRAMADSVESRMAELSSEPSDTARRSA